MSAWHGTPLDLRNVGCHLEAGTLLCLVGEPGRIEAIMLVEQSDIPLVRLGQRVRLAIDQPPALVLEGTVAEIASSEAELPYEALALALDLPQRMSADGGTPAWQKRSQVRVELDPHRHSTLIGSCGRAKIIAPPQSLAVRLNRFIQRTFSLP